jgi:RNA polymerase sigma factor (sigma-70 family)
MSLTDAELITRVLADDDRHAFATLVRRHQSSVRSLLRRLTAGDAARADDLAQEAFLRAYRGLASFRGGAKLSTWLYRIAYRVFLSDARARGPAATDHGTAAPDESTPMDRVALRHDLERAMAALRPEERAALALTYGQDTSHEEAAAILDCPVGTLKTYVLRAKEKLRLELDEEAR